jgi:hypothetical protein
MDKFRFSFVLPPAGIEPAQDEMKNSRTPVSGGYLL